ncbi:hypothetical protein [uncultured Formosa sp.]|uniref:hypothetical protein n=1 Tax=uncultured Formosa sp. TaxID=255435 RepID=UPI00261FCD44|nr:hypothetical protein [uncultured Formosa sp.]
MKNIYKTFCLLALSGFVFTSCDDSDDNTGDSLIDYTKVGAIVSTPNPSITVSESDIHSSGEDYIIPYTVTLNEAVTATTIIELIQTDGEADTEDYETSVITVTPGNTTGTGYITIFSNGYIEGTETLELTANSRANVTINDYAINITIDDDYINDQLNFELSWSGTFTAAVGDGADLVLDFCAMDFDIYIYDANLNDTGFYDAATGSCPETATLSGLEDGFYYVVVDLYENPLDIYGGEISVPLTFSWSQDYFDDVTGSTTLEAYTTVSTSGTYAIATITIQDGYIYTIAAY